MVQVEEVVEIYKAIARIPTLVAARVLKKLCGPSYTAIISSWTQRNIEIGELTKFDQCHLVGNDGDCKRFLPVDTSGELLTSISASESRKAVLKEVLGNSSRKLVLNIWDDFNLSKSIDLSALDVHGDVYTDAEFGCLEWSPCEKKVLYIAEKKQPKTEPFYKRKPQDKKEDLKGAGESDPAKKVTKGEEYVYREDFGEQLLGKIEPVIAICDVEEECVSVFDSELSNMCPGQLMWTPDGEGIVGVAWNVLPRKLGLIHCTNRESYVFHLTLSGDLSLLSEDDKAVRSPRFSPDGKFLVWLERNVGGPHHSTHRLMCCTWNHKQKRVLISIIDDQVDVGGESPFCGIYCLSLPRRCWRSNSQEIIFSTPQECCVRSFSVEVDTGTIRALSDYNGSVTVLDVFDDIVLCSRSSFDQPPELILGRLPVTCGEEICWLTVTENVYPIALNIAFSHMNLTHDQPESCKFTAMLVHPKNPVEGTPLLVCPHGGPHGVSCNIFSSELALFVFYGFAVLLINYRGSVGAGEKNVNWLPGRIGDSDVEDVRLATKEAISANPFLTAKNILLFGRSHGGFLVTLLSGKYPFDYRAVVAGNPVTDVAAMFSVTDIPDWTCVETGFPYNAQWTLTPEAFAKMRECSPINYIDYVRAPTLLLIGKKDARVPPSQGIQYYNGLKARGTEAKLLLYDDNHKLGQVLFEIDAFINTILWFMKYSQENE